MRFGITAHPFRAIMNPEITLETLVTRIDSFEYADVVRHIAELGFNPIELTGDAALFFPHAFSPRSIAKLASLKEELDLSYTVHLPLWSVEPSSPLAPVRRGSVQALVDALNATRPLEPEVYVLHATNALASEFYRSRRSEPLKSYLLQQFQRYARESLEALLGETNIPSRSLAIETVEFPFELTLALAQDLDVSMCLDTGHVLVGFSGPIGLFDALEQALPHLAEVHLHDGPWQGSERTVGFGKDHQPLGAGDLDVARFLTQLTSANYRGPLIFELGVEQALTSLEVVRSVYPAAVVSETQLSSKMNP